jgi:magnesium transporter
MMNAYALEGARLVRLADDADPAAAIWIDLFRPEPEAVARVTALGVDVPSLAEMEEIEISNRLYGENGVDYMTVVLPGSDAEGEQVSGPVTFVLVPGQRLVTVRHHAPRPFETFPARADRAVAGCSTPERVMIGLIEEIIARQADHLEGAGRLLDGVARSVYAGGAQLDTARLREHLQEIGRQGELLGRVRLALLSVERALSFVGVTQTQNRLDAKLKPVVKGLARDINALEVHIDFLGNRVALIADATLGMINLEQAATVRIVSVVAVIFLPPTVIASAYGMNFARMPELEWLYGYPMALGMMLASAVLTYLFFRWKGML